jgi:hypothetical protein
MNNKIYEVYVYCDPRDIGVYKYGEYIFLNKPIYVGKGSMKWKRKYVHINNSSNKRLKNLIAKLKRHNLKPTIITINKSITEYRAIQLEKFLIKTIGRSDLNLCPLFNFTGGGDGTSGRIFSDEERSLRSLNTKKYFNGLSKEELKAHGKKSLAGRTERGKQVGIKKQLRTKKAKSEHEKAKLEKKRYISWSKSYYSRSDKDKAITSKKCQIASKKRPQYFITIQYLDDGLIQSKFLNEWLNEGFARDGIMDRIKSKNISKPLYSRTTKKNISILKVIKKEISINHAS